MKTLKSLLYYVAILLPLIGIGYLMLNQTDTKTSVVLLFVYAFVYRPLTDAWRLWDKKILTRQNLLKYYPYWWRLKWLRDLYRL